MAKTKDALGRQGVGALTEIDGHAVLAANISPESADRIGRYLGLGAWNPHLATRGLLTEPKFGARLPLNGFVHRAADATETTTETIVAQLLAQLRDARKGAFAAVGAHHH